MPMPKFIDNIRKKVTEETVQENLPTFADLLVAGIGLLIFFNAGRTGNHNSIPDHTSVTNNYYYYGKENHR